MSQSRRGFLGFLSVLPWWRRRTAGTAPGTERVELDRFFVAGLRHHAPELLPQLTADLELHLAPEPDNPHHSCAVAIYFKERRIGYVPRDRNETISRLLDQHVAVACRLVAVDHAADPWEAVEVSVTIPCCTNHP